jgi:hypothetical protein
MIFLKRRRLITWLLKAYLKKWRKTILISFLVGLIVFFVLKFGVNYFIPLIPFTQQQTVGLSGTYTVDNLPSSILSKVSRGLTYISGNDTPQPDLATSWDIKDNGRTYVFHLKKNVNFDDGTPLTSDQIKYNFLNVTEERPDPYTIIFNLKSSYSPFLVTVSRPIFRSGFTGIGDYRVQSVNLNGNFVQSLSLVSVKGKNKEILYQFYPTEESLKTAFALGEVDNILGVKGLSIDGGSLASFKNVSISKNTNYSDLVTLFYDTQDKTLSDKR